MKKLIILLLSSIMLCTFSAHADETKIIKLNNISSTSTIVGTVCLEGFLFAYVSHPWEGGTDIIQVYDENNKPYKCQ